MSEYCREVVWAPGGAFSPEPDTALVLDGTDEIDGEVSDDGHVFCAVAGSQARLVFTEGDIQYPMQAVLNGPMAAHGLGCVRVSKRPRSLSSAREATRTIVATSGSRSSPGKRRSPSSQPTSWATVTVRCSMRPWPLSTSTTGSRLAAGASAKKRSISECSVG